MQKISYSKMEIFEQCSFRYKLQYVDKHYINAPTTATDFGTLIHFVEESIARQLTSIFNESYLLDYTYFIDILENGDQNEHVLGINQLKQKYPTEFYAKDKNNLTYEDKYKMYLKSGIYRLANYLEKNQNLEIIGIEQEFNLEYGDYLFHGFIDRVFRDKNTGKIYIEDIKTWDNTDGHDLVTPLQFVIYSLAAEKIYNVSLDDISCAYDLPLAENKYAAGTKNFISRGIKKIDRILAEIEAGQFEPQPSPLCYWCVYSATYPNQPEEAKNLCPYFSHWTREHKDFSVEYEWMGFENHQKILEAFINNQNKQNVEIIEITKKSDSTRRFMLRR